MVDFELDIKFLFLDLFCFKGEIIWLIDSLYLFH